MTPALSDTTIWTVILVLGVGTYLLRFSFLGALGRRQLPEWMLRHLRYTPVAVLPALVAPGIIWPTATGGHPDAARMIAAAATVAAGIVSRSIIVAIGTGLVSLYLALWLVG